MTTPSALSGRDTSHAAGAAPVLAAVGLGMVAERHADLVARACVEHVRSAGGTDVFGATHPTVLGEQRGVGLLVEARGLAVPALQTALHEATEAERGDDASWAVLAGGRLVGDPGHGEALEPVLRAGALRSTGRVVAFPGQAGHETETTVGALLTTTAVDRVEVLGGAPADPATTLLTRGHLRPRWVAGDLVLHVQPARGGVLVPFETPDPTPCCAAHG